MNLLLFNLRTDADDSVLGFTTDWINALAERSDRIVVITMVEGRLAVAPNVSVFSIGKEKGYSEPRRVLEFYRILLGVLKANKVDACFAHMMPLFAVMGWPLLRWRRIPTVLWYAHKQVPLLLRVATWCVDRVVASSRSGYRINSPKFRSLGQGIDVERFRWNGTVRKPCTRFTVLTIGRISRIKRLEVLLTVLRDLEPQERERLVVRYVGDPLTSDDHQYLAELRATARAYGLADYLELAPAVPFPKIHEAYQTADLFVNCSDTDSIDKTVLEAMSSGLPVITSNAAFHSILGDLRELCTVGKNDSEALRKQIQKFLAMSPGERMDVGARLRDIVVRQHSLSGLADRLIAEVESVMRAPGASNADAC